MTIIACSRYEMLADTSLTDESADRRVGHVQKIYKCKDGSIAGAAGGSVAGLAFLKWAKAGRKGKFPEAAVAKDETFEGLVLTAKGEILAFGGPDPEIIMDDTFAIGSGAGYAQAALFVGATLQRAVEAAIHASPKCGGQITRIALDNA